MPNDGNTKRITKTFSSSVPCGADGSGSTMGNDTSASCLILVILVVVCSECIGIMDEVREQTCRMITMTNIIIGNATVFDIIPIVFGYLPSSCSFCE
eukprot:CAMPEP_0184703106 /NCGR_PEP_ID=MMETSP0313-20130426/26621_1 /TAXON_ID=2792 /ORGANISM="Porphyridium aerugineum, Strain SAG 1380-2" /LENGTH=96 /DNA_ID=CAMNT_0027163789 /DNA_START=149 /DNA_END=439 /DNA_ORIENTATION=+